MWRLRRLITTYASAHIHVPNLELFVLIVNVLFVFILLGCELLLLLLFLLFVSSLVARRRASITFSPASRADLFPPLRAASHARLAPLSISRPLETQRPLVVKKRNARPQLRRNHVFSTRLFVPPSRFTCLPTRVFISSALFLLYLIIQYSCLLNILMQVLLQHQT